MGGKYGYIDKTGKEVTPLKYDYKYDYANNFTSESGGLAAVRLDDKWGYIDKTGKEVIPLKYDTAYDFSEGIVQVGFNDKYGFIDKSGKEIIPIKYEYIDEFREGLARVGLNNKEGFIDKTGKEVVSIEYDYVGFFTDGLAVVGLNDRFGCIDRKGNEIIPLKYDWIHDYSKEILIVRLDKKIGIIKNPLLNNQETKPIAPQEKSILATPTVSRVLVNGKDVSFDAYLIEDNNYFKLRDLAHVINGTKKQFEVKWDGNKKAINLVSNKPYAKDGSEMTKGNGIDVVPTLNTSIIYKDGVKLNLKAYNINGNNFFRLRDIAKAFDIGVTYDKDTKTIGVDTSLIYKED